MLPCTPGTCKNLNPNKAAANGNAVAGVDYQCTCDTGYTGATCNVCANGYFGAYADGNTGTCVDGCVAFKVRPL